MTTIITLGSGSSGNCYVVESMSNGELSKRLIIEAGIRFNAVQNALNYELGGIEGVLVTHEHTDHAGFVGEFAKRGFIIYATRGTIDAFKLPVGAGCIAMQKKKVYNVGSFKVMAFQTEHDAAEPCGFIIDCPDGNRILFATDTYYLKFRFTGITIFMIECNYEESLLQRNIQSGVIHPSVGNRVRKSHMSLTQCIKMFKANDLSKVKKIILIHLSGNNSKTEYFIKSVSEATGKIVLAAKEGIKAMIF